MRLTHGNIRLLIIAAVLVSVLTWPAGAQAQEQNFSFRAHGTWTSPTGDFDLTSPEGQRITASTNQPVGFSVGIEYRPEERVGFEFSAMYARPTVDAASVLLGERTEATGELLFMPLSVAVNVHATPGRALDVYFGGSLLYAVYGDLSLSAPGEGRTFVRGHNDPGWGMHLGVDVPLGHAGWSFSAAIRYMSTNFAFTDVEDDMDFEMKFNPFVLNLGVSARF
jgi:outer membrane protein W